MQFLQMILIFSVLAKLKQCWQCTKCINIHFKVKSNQLSVNHEKTNFMLYTPKCSLETSSSIILLLSIIVETFYCNDTLITECNINDTQNSLTAYILLYKSIAKCLWPDREGRELIDSHDVGTFVSPFNTGKETYVIDSRFPTDDLWFDSDISYILFICLIGYEICI